jgi:predicted DNA-binding transcriptional regulator YafY
MQITQKTHRLNELITLLEQSLHPLKIKTLAQQLNCNPKTIRRYISELEYHRRAPYFIKNGYIEIDSQQRQNTNLINGYWLDKKNIENLINTYQLISNLPKELATTAQQNLKQTLIALGTEPQKNNPLKNHIQLIPSQPVKTHQPTFQTIINSLLEKKQLHIHYWNRNTDIQTERTISPQKLVLYKDQWYLDAYCHNKNALRTFNLLAITNIQTLETPSKKISKKQLKQHYTSSYGIYGGQNDKTAIIQFTAKTARWIKYCQWHPEQTTQENPNGSINIQIPYHNPTELIADILKWGEEATILSPTELIQEIQHKINQMQKNYKK